MNTSDLGEEISILQCDIPLKARAFEKKNSGIHNEQNQNLR
jgi:hypothetical protein